MRDNKLIGKTIKAIELASDREAIRFILTGGEVVEAFCDGDCCSHTWIEDLINPEAAIGSEVLHTGELDLPEEFQTPTKTGNFEEEVTYYGFFVETAKGRFILAYRNSSNGYYGGNLAWPGEYRYGGVYRQNVSNEDWQLVAGERS